MSEWQPIETAPKDGEPILVWAPNWGAHGGHVVARWWVRSSGWIVDEWDRDPPGYVDATTLDPAHWMPLPAPPEPNP